MDEISNPQFSPSRLFPSSLFNSDKTCSLHTTEKENWITIESIVTSQDWYDSDLIWQWYDNNLIWHWHSNDLIPHWCDIVLVSHLRCDVDLILILILITLVVRH